MKTKEDTATRKIPQAWVPVGNIHRVLAANIENANDSVLTDWRVLDDRGGSGCFLIRFESGPPVSVVRRIVGKTMHVEMVDLP